MPSVFLIYTSYWLVIMIKLNHAYNIQQEDWSIIDVQEIFVEGMDILCISGFVSSPMHTVGLQITFLKLKGNVFLYSHVLVLMPLQRDVPCYFP